jgi:hypothetical protein
MALNQMLERLIGATVIAFVCCGSAIAADASFHCVVKSAYEADRGETLAPNTMMREGTRVDVLMHNGKALVSHQLFGFTNPTTGVEFTILQEGGKQNSWTLFWNSGPSMFADVKRTNTILLHIKTWRLKVKNPEIPFYLDYEAEILLGTCDRTAGEVSFENEK